MESNVHKAHEIYDGCILCIPVRAYSSSDWGLGKTLPDTEPSLGLQLSDASVRDSRVGLSWAEELTGVPWVFSYLVIHTLS